MYYCSQVLQNIERLINHVVSEIIKGLVKTVDEWMDGSAEEDDSSLDVIRVRIPIFICNIC